MSGHYIWDHVVVVVVVGGRRSTKQTEKDESRAGSPVQRPVHQYSSFVSSRLVTSRKAGVRVRCRKCTDVGCE